MKSSGHELNGPVLITCLNYCFDIELLFKGPVYLNYRGIWWIIISSPSWIVELKEKLTNKTQVDDISEDDDENESTSLLLLFRFLLLDCDTFFHLWYEIQNITRMHFSRMHTIRCSGRLWGEGVCLGGCLPREGVCPGGVCETPPVNRITDRCKNITLPQLCCGR